MKNKRLFVNIISIIIILLIPVILYGFNFNSTAFDRDLYKKEFSKYNVYNNLKNYDVEDINNKVLNYLRFDSNNRLIDSDFFNEREKTHLLDVKGLMQKVLTLYYFSVILFSLLSIILALLLNFNFRIIGKRILIILLIGSLLTLLDAAAFFLLSSFNFDFAFDLFHKTFFAQGTYLFNPEFENIVVLYPENLFFDFLVKIVLNTILSSIILVFVSLIFLFAFFGKKITKNFPNFPVGKHKKQKL